jgi:DNA-binding response OmpR family regulator
MEALAALMGIRVNPSHSKSHRIVLVADDDAFSQNLVKLLEDSHCAVDLAVSARMAGALLERHHDAIVVLDLNSQKMHAVEFALALRKRASRPATLAISSMPNLAQHCRALGVRHWLAQPFRLGELLETLDRLARRPITLAPTRTPARPANAPMQ